MDPHDKQIAWLKEKLETAPRSIVPIIERQIRAQEIAKEIRNKRLRKIAP